MYFSEVCHHAKNRFMKQLVILTISTFFFIGCGQLNSIKHRPFSDNQKQRLKSYNEKYYYHPHPKIKGNVDILKTDSGLFVAMDSVYFQFNDSNLTYLELFKIKLIPLDIIKNTVHVFSFEEFYYFPISKHQRRFKFWYYQTNQDGFFYINPNECIFELTNKNANRKTDLKTFISGAELTFYRQYGLL